ILGNAQTIAPDIGAAAFGVLAAYLFRGWLNSTGWFRASVAGVGLGLAELTKTTWIVLFALWPILWLIFRLVNRPLGLLSWARDGAQLLLILLLGVYIINVGYAFDHSFERLGEYRFVSKSLGGDVNPPNKFATSALGFLPVPLPRDYVLGIDEQKRDFE